MNELPTLAVRLVPIPTQIRLFIERQMLVRIVLLIVRTNSIGTSGSRIRFASPAQEYSVVREVFEARDRGIEMS